MDDQEAEIALRELLDVLRPSGQFDRLDHVCEKKHLLILAEQIGEWRSVARWLDLGETIINELDRKEGGEGKRQEMLLEWRMRNGSKATYRRLAKNMMNCEKRHLAEKVVILSTKVQNEESSHYSTPCGGSPPYSTPLSSPSRSAHSGSNPPPPPNNSQDAQKTFTRLVSWHLEEHLNVPSTNGPLRPGNQFYSPTQSNETSPRHNGHDPNHQKQDVVRQFKGCQQGGGGGGGDEREGWSGNCYGGGVGHNGGIAVQSSVSPQHSSRVGNVEYPVKDKGGRGHSPMESSLYHTSVVGQRNDSGHYGANNVAYNTPSLQQGKQHTLETSPQRSGRMVGQGVHGYSHERALAINRGGGGKVGVGRGYEASHNGIHIPPGNDQYYVRGGSVTSDGNSPQDSRVSQQSREHSTTFTCGRSSSSNGYNQSCSTNSTVASVQYHTPHNRDQVQMNTPVALQHKQALSVESSLCQQQYQHTDIASSQNKHTIRNTVSLAPPHHNALPHTTPTPTQDHTHSQCALVLPSPSSPLIPTNVTNKLNFLSSEALPNSLPAHSVSKFREMERENLRLKEQMKQMEVMQERLRQELYHMKAAHDREKRLMEQQLVDTHSDMKMFEDSFRHADARNKHLESFLRASMKRLNLGQMEGTDGNDGGIEETDFAELESNASSSIVSRSSTSSLVSQSSTSSTIDSQEHFYFSPKHCMSYKEKEVTVSFSVRHCYRETTCIRNEGEETNETSAGKTKEEKEEEEEEEEEVEKNSVIKKQLYHQFTLKLEKREKEYIQKAHDKLEQHCEKLRNTSTRLTDIISRSLESLNSVEEEADTSSMDRQTLIKDLQFVQNNLKKHQFSRHFSWPL